MEALCEKQTAIISHTHFLFQSFFMLESLHQCCICIFLWILLFSEGRRVWRIGTFKNSDALLDIRNHWTTMYFTISSSKCQIW